MTDGESVALFAQEQREPVVHAAGCIAGSIECSVVLCVGNSTVSTPKCVNLFEFKSREKAILAGAFQNNLPKTKIY